MYETKCMGFKLRYSGHLAHMESIRSGKIDTCRKHPIWTELQLVCLPMAKTRHLHRFHDGSQMDANLKLQLKCQNLGI